MQRLHGAQARAVEVVLEQRPWYNPDLNSRWFFVPGVIATLTLTIVVNLTSFAVVREREVGTLEQVMVTPIRPLEFILGKTIPFFLVGLAIVALIATVGTLWFRIPFVGNPLVLLLGTSLYLLSVLGIGLLISTLCVDAAAGVRDQLLRRQSDVHSLRIQLPDCEHAGRLAVAHLSRSGALLPRDHPGNLPQGGRRGGAVAANARSGRSRRPRF